MAKPVRQVGCPFCGAMCTDETDNCSACGHPLYTTASVRRGTILAKRYEVLRPLGAGGMGMVYQARDQALEEIVAIKVLRPELARLREHSRRFRSEIKLARKIAHRNVCRIFEYHEEEWLSFIVMEYVEGTDYRQIVRGSGGLPPCEAFTAAIQVSWGLAAIHEAGVVHRDLKTPNIMRDSRGQLKLMDFGIAKDLGGQGSGATSTATGLIVGTPEYMSPEQARGSKVDRRSDIYSLGIVTYELFTGRVPFHGDTPLAVLLKHVNDTPRLSGPGLEALPPALVPVLQRALAKDPEERFADADEMAEALAQAQLATPGAGQPPLARASGLPASTPPPGNLVPAVRATGQTGVPPQATQSITTLTSARTLAARHPGAFWGGVATLALLGVLGCVALVVAFRRPGPPRTEGSIGQHEASAAVVPTPAPAAAGLFVTVNALPWARVKVLRLDPPGGEVGAQRLTPFWLTLPEGAYRLQLENGGLTPPLEQDVHVETGAPNRFTVTMPGFDAQRVVAEMGVK